MQTGNQRMTSSSGLLTTLACSTSDQKSYALEEVFL